MRNSPSNIRKKPVVIADDDAGIRTIIKKALLNSEYEVIAEASNGLELYNKCKILTPDVAIVDIQMPTIDGISAARMIVDERLVKSVIILTSFDDKEFVSGAIDAGVAGYLTKPLDVELLIPTIDNALCSSKALYDKGKELNKIVKKKKSLKYIDKAKLCLMESKGISEENAYMMLKEYSKRNQLPLESVAKIIISKMGKANE